MLSLLRKHFGERILNWSATENMITVQLETGTVIEGAAYLKKLGFRITAVTCVDEKEYLMAVYSFVLDSNNLVVSLSSKTDRKEPQSQSVCGIYPAAEMLQKEASEMYGINFLTGDEKKGKEGSPSRGKRKMLKDV